MHRDESSFLFAVLFVAACGRAELPPPEPATLGSMLRPGTELIYENEEGQHRWVVESLEQPASIAGLSQCIRMNLRRAPAPVPESRAWCVQDLQLKAWNDSSLELTPLRPLGPAMTLELPRRGGGLVRYETSAFEMDTIGSMVIDVIPTTVTTMDSTGRAVSRLRERYAPGLATATRGVFEEPGPDNWRTTLQFRLIEVRHAGQ